MYDSELAEIIQFTHQRWPCTKQPSWNSSTNIFYQTIFSLGQKLDEGFREHGDSEIAKIIAFAYQWLPSTKQQSWIHSNIIIFQTIYPLEQKLDGRQQTDRLHRKAEIIPLRCQRGPSNKQPSWNSSNYTFQTICPRAETWWETSGKINSEWLEQFFSNIKEGHTLVIRLIILQTTYFVDYMFLTVLSVVWDWGNSWSYPLFCHCSLGQWNRLAV